jgi:hypothetical protein
VIAAGARFVQGYLLARPAFPPPPITWPASMVRVVPDGPPKRETSPNLRALRDVREK